MQFDNYSQIVKLIKLRKHLPDAVYLHNSALDTLPKALTSFLNKIIKRHELEKQNWDIVKFCYT
jgi:hypothetical protein